MQSVTSSRNKKPKVKLQEDDRKCQENVNRRPIKSQINADKSCQEKKNIHMWPVKPETEVQLLKPVPYEYRRLCKDQTCQSTRCYKKHSDSEKRQKMQYNVPRRGNPGCDQ